MNCTQPQAHPDRCGCQPSGVEQVSSAWLAQLRSEYLQYGEECTLLQAENKALQAELATLKAADALRRHKFDCLVDHAKRQDIEIAKLRYDENVRRFYDEGAVWFWAGDETDSLETLACPVVINAGDLRALIAPSTPGALPARRGLLELIEQSWRVPNGHPASVPEHVEALIENGLRELRDLLARVKP